LSLSPSFTSIFIHPILITSYALAENRELKQIKIEADDKIEWIYPSLIDINAPKDRLCNIKFAKRTKGVLRVFLNNLEVLQKNIDAKAYEVIKIGWINMEVKEGDRLKIVLDR